MPPPLPSPPAHPTLLPTLSPRPPARPQVAIDSNGMLKVTHMVPMAPAGPGASSMSGMPGTLSLPVATAATQVGGGLPGMGGGLKHWGVGGGGGMGGVPTLWWGHPCTHVGNETPGGDGTHACLRA
jgi:hypothetical protein